MRRNPRNDYSLHFVVSGERPQNFILEGSTLPSDRFAEFPTRRELVELKREHVSKYAASPQYLKCDLKTFKLSPVTLGSRFDVILVDPPWDQYGGASWTFEEIRALTLEDIADPGGSFCFLWCGSGNADGLERGRECLAKWGYRRCEDVCWLKTNKRNKTSSEHSATATTAADPLLVPTKEHCLVGVMGSIRRSRDAHIIHANIDTDVIISEEPEDPSSTRKPDELYDIICNFVQGTRRLELFGCDHNVRDGWLTLGLEISSSNFVVQTLVGGTSESEHLTHVSAGATGVTPPGAGHLLPYHPRIEALRPKTPPFRMGQR